MHDFVKEFPIKLHEQGNDEDLRPARQIRDIHFGCLFTSNTLLASSVGSWDTVKSSRLPLDAATGFHRAQVTSPTVISLRDSQHLISSTRRHRNGCSPCSQQQNCLGPHESCAVPANCRCTNFAHFGTLRLRAMIILSAVPSILTWFRHFEKEVLTWLQKQLVSLC